MKITIDIIGWAGSAMIVIAYILISLHKVNAASMIYQILNVVGSALLIVHTVYYHTMPAVALNVVWLCVGIIAIIRIRTGKIPKTS